jgi:hypothetical protein
LVETFLGKRGAKSVDAKLSDDVADWLDLLTRLVLNVVHC